ncbi:26S proteasome regulatory subunit [Boothiomyces sp. JEL0838]|nr:26S proteasome regulatory subunit [Boothiomyces sp. JEL0838]
MQVDLDIAGYLSQQKTKYPEFKDIFAQFETLYDQKLWHQLTVALEKLLANPKSHSLLIPLYNNFVKDWESKMNQISLVKFVSLTSVQLGDHKKALEFLTPFATKLKSDDSAKDAYVLISTEIARNKLLSGDLEGCKTNIEECEKILDSLPGTDPVINAGFYRVSSDYFKATMGYPQYYHNALLFLSSVSLDDLTVQEKQERAFELCMSALLGEGLYNFGELLMHPILNTLQGSSYAWLRELLFFYNSGNMEGFEKTSKSGEFLRQPLLVSALPFLRQKLCLMTLVESVFKRSKEERGRLSFADISKETRVAFDEVEHLVMKALSLGLIKGSIDEVDSIVSVSWVQPRVLDKNQIGHIGKRIEEWSLKVNQQVIGLESQESFTSVFAQ